MHAFFYCPTTGGQFEVKFQVWQPSLLLYPPSLFPTYLFSIWQPIESILFGASSQLRDGAAQADTEGGVQALRKVLRT